MTPYVFTVKYKSFLFGEIMYTTEKVTRYETIAQTREEAAVELVERFIGVGDVLEVI